MKSVITFRLRKELDADLLEMGIDENTLAELCRNGLRLMLGIQTTKQFEVKERPITPIVEVQRQQRPAPKEKTAPAPGRPAVYIPNQRRV